MTLQHQRFEKTLRWDVRRQDLEAQVQKWDARVRRHGGHVAVVERQDLQVPRQWFAADKAVVHATRYVIEAPVVAGEAGRVVGTFELAEDNDSVYAVPAPGFTSEDLDPFRARWQECDHCKTQRRRLASFVVQREDGSRLVVGRACSIAFMGLPFEAIAASLGAAVELREGDPEDWSFGGTPLYDVVSLLNGCWTVAKTHGGYNRDLRDLMVEDLNLLFGWVRSPTDMQVRRQRTLRENEVKFGKLDLEAFAAYLDGARGDFADNLRIACRCERVELKRLNMLLAGVGMFVGKALKREADKVADAARPPAKLVNAEEGRRVELVADCVRTLPFDSAYGVKTLCVLKGMDGENVIWWSTAADLPEAGKRYRLKGTIKSHGTDRRTGEPQTTMTRCALAELMVA